MRSALRSICIILFVAAPLHASEMNGKTPDDVFQRVSILKQQVELLWQADHINAAWPAVDRPSGLAPRHVLQKSLEVLDKIKRLRRIREMGPITVPLFPTRKITPSEVFDMAGRLIEEVKLFPALQGVSLSPVDISTGKTPSDVYQALWNISLAMDPLLGVRGLKFSDVYGQSLKILAQVKFLRISQSLPLNIPPPQKTQGKRSNHMLQQAYLLLGSIAMAEHNLWVEPIRVPTVPRREIKPGEVYDVLLIAQAELERIKYRLGIERDIASVETEGHKSSDDVLFNLVWATQMMPQFTNDVVIKQYPAQLLNKSPNHLYGVAQHIIEELQEYRRQRGIQVVPREVPTQANLKSYHVYQKAQHVLAKISRVREQEQLGPLAMPSGYLRQITHAEVYDLLIRIDAELQLFYDLIDMPAELAELARARVYRNKTESDVFRQMWTISYLLDDVLGSEGYTLTDVFAQARFVAEELNIIAQATKRSVTGIELPTLVKGSQPIDVLNQSHVVMKQIKTLKRRVGLLGQALPLSPSPDEVTPDDVHNAIELILSELGYIKIYLGITQMAQPTRTEIGEKTPSQVLQQLQLAAHLLAQFIE